MSAKFGVVAWKLQGGDPLDPEELEVCKLSTLIFKDASMSTPGVTVQLQFKQTLWEGTILSVYCMSNVWYCLIFQKQIYSDLGLQKLQFSLGQGGKSTLR